jgi:predicted DNA binding CopG/RHH family protein
MKKTPKFNSEDEERDFWDTHDMTDYFDMSKAERVSFPNLRPTVKSISIRLPLALIERLKLMGRQKDVPYQSLIKVFLDERVYGQGKKRIA